MDLIHLSAIVAGSVALSRIETIGDRSMHAAPLTMNSLFKQLGLAHSDHAIVAFVQRHSPLCPAVPLHKSLIWNPSQVAFLQQAIADDSEWSTLADQLDTRLRKENTK